MKLAAICQQLLDEIEKLHLKRHDHFIKSYPPARNLTHEELEKAGPITITPEQEKTSSHTLKQLRISMRKSLGLTNRCMNVLLVTENRMPLIPPFALGFIHLLPTVRKETESPGKPGSVLRRWSLLCDNLERYANEVETWMKSKYAFGQIRVMLLSFI